MEIVEELRGLLFDNRIAPDVESYIRHIQQAYELIIGEKMELRDGPLDTRIRDMFAYMESIGILEVLEDERPQCGMQRAESTVSKRACQATAAAGDHCELRGCED